VADTAETEAPFYPCYELGAASDGELLRRIIRAMDSLLFIFFLLEILIPPTFPLC
jgi:hypothetical protein